MAISNPKTFVNVTSSGGTILFSADDCINGEGILTIASAITLSSSLTVSYSGTPTFESYFKIIYPGSITKGANAVTIFGMSLSASQALIPAIFEARWNGTSYNVWYLPATSAPVSNQIDDLALNQLVQQTGPGLIGRSPATLGDMSYQTLTNEGNVFSLYGGTLAVN